MVAVAQERRSRNDFPESFYAYRTNQANWLTLDIGGRNIGLSRYRLYDAELGIFLSRDFLPFLNKYRCWSNNPVGQVDRDGLREADTKDEAPPKKKEPPEQPLAVVVDVPAYHPFVLRAEGYPFSSVCGDFRIAAKWALQPFEGGRPKHKGGFIVQKIIATFDVRDCISNKPISDKRFKECFASVRQTTFWEVWKVAPGQVSPDKRDIWGTAQRAASSGCPGTIGTIVIQGEAVFYESPKQLADDAVPPGKFKKGDKKTLAPHSETTRNDPGPSFVKEGYKKHSQVLVRHLEAKWTKENPRTQLEYPKKQ